MTIFCLGDLVTVRQPCSGSEPGVVYRLINNAGEDLIINNNTESDHEDEYDPGCACVENWIKVNPAIKPPKDSLIKILC